MNIKLKISKNVEVINKIICCDKNQTLNQILENVKSNWGSNSWICVFYNGKNNEVDRILWDLQIKIIRAKLCMGQNIS